LDWSIVRPITAKISQATLAEMVGTTPSIKPARGYYSTSSSALPVRLVGGYLFNVFGAVGVTGFNLWSMLVAVIGAMVILAVYHAIAGRRV
jgi:Transglycosylase associated protein